MIIQTENLSKSYKEIHALKALNLSVPKNSIYGFLGPNGAGKTTTIKLLLGLIKPTHGGGSIFGLDVVQESIDIRRRIGYLPQDPRFYEHMTARETLAFTARFFFKGPDKKIAERVNEVLELVGLSGKADRPIKGFSGGERQRLGIGQAQVNFPELLILDEPAASLDPLGRRDVLEVMERLRDYATVFYCTHILDDVQRVSDTVAILNQGRLISQGAIGDLLNGADNLVYSVKIQGDTHAAEARVSEKPWVTDLKANRQNGVTAWDVKVSDAAAAEEQMLRLLLADDSMVVKAFGRKTYDLEDVFVEIINGGQHVG
jgi:ABC-2 type transport system ATP-binding protein